MKKCVDWNNESKTIEQIARYVEDELDTTHIPQPIFIVGSSGSGKTTTAEMLVSYLKDSGMADMVRIFDGRQFFSSRDIINAIQGGDPDKSHYQKRNIAIIDDLDYYFKRSTFEDQYILRNFLNNESAPLVIATISEIGNYLADYRAPFFEGVRIIYLPKYDGIHESKKIPAEIYQRMAQLMKYMPPVVRSSKIAADIVRVSDSKDSDMKELLDRVGPYYRIVYEELPVNSQKILYHLSKSEDPLTLSSLRVRTGLPAGILSSYLRQLIKSGIIRKTNPAQHGTPYEISDNLLKLWLSVDTANRLSEDITIHIANGLRQEK